MDKQLQAVGVESELVIIAGADHGVAGAGPNVSQQAEAFVHKTLSQAAE